MGTTCGDHPSTQAVFTHENVELVVSKAIYFDPLVGRYEYILDWSGTQVMINDRIGLVQARPQDIGSCTAWFDGEQESTYVSGIDDKILRRFYVETRGDLEPPPLALEEHRLQAAELLAEPFAPISIHRDEETRQLSHLSIGSDAYGWRETSFPFYVTLHRFCNLYVRWRFGLGYESRGGFIGRGFRVENSHLLGRQLYGLVVYLGHPKNTPAVLEAVRALDVEHAAMSAPEPNANIETVISTWATIMTTLLRYPWYDMPAQTIGDIWQNYCRMQDVLLNVLPVDDIHQVLAFAKTQGNFAI